MPKCCAEPASMAEANRVQLSAGWTTTSWLTCCGLAACGQLWLTPSPYGSGFNEIKFHEKFDLTKINVRFRRDENFRRVKSTTLARFLSGAVRPHTPGERTALADASDVA